MSNYPSDEKSLTAKQLRQAVNIARRQVRDNDDKLEKGRLRRLLEECDRRGMKRW